MKKGSWEIKKIKDVCTFFNDGNWIESKDQSENGIRLIQTGNIANGYYIDKESRAKFISEGTFKELKCIEIFGGDCLISRLPDPIGRACILPPLVGRAITAVDCSILRFKEEIVSSYFVYFTQTKQYALSIDKSSTGSTRKRVSRSNLGNILIPVPPLPIQEQIVVELDALNDILEKKRQQLAEFDTLAQATFYDMFGDPVENEKGWEVKKLGDVITTLTDYHANGSYEVLKKNVILLNTLDYALMVRTTDLENNNFQNDCIYIDEFAYNYLEKSKVFGGEIIMNKIGSAGKVYMMPFLNRPVSLGMNAFLIRTDTNKTNNIYLFHYLTSPYGSTIINKKVKGAVTKTITKEAVRDLFLPLPPLSLQDQFAEQIEAIEKQKELINQSIAEVQKLFDYTMDKYFN